MLELVLEFGEKLGVIAQARVLLAQLVQRPHQRLGHEDAAVGTEMAPRIGKIVARC